jgi:disulfide oxidoreductase YuzD
MPEYNKDERKLIYSAEESVLNHCPVCGAEPDYERYEHFDDAIHYPWDCHKCGATGYEYSEIEFKGHYVDVTGDYSEKHKREIVKAYAGSPNYDELRLDDIIMSPGCLINITGSISEEDLESISNDEEYAVRFAYRVVRGRLDELEKAA